jgi:hypothetical protein
MEGVTQYQCIKNNIFGDLLDQPKDHGIIEIALQRNDNGPCRTFETSPFEAKHKFYRK